MKTTKKKFLYYALGAAVLLLVLASWGGLFKQPVASNQSSAISIGKEAYIRPSDGKYSAIALEKADLDALQTAQAANDTTGVQQLVDNGRVFLLSKETKVLVVDGSLFAVKVRIEDGTHAGEVGWIPTELVSAI